MKKLFLSALLVGATLPVMAQFSGNTTGKSQTSSFPSSYDRFSVGYNANMITGKNAHDEGYTMHGVAAQYTHGWAVSQSAPVYIDLGVRLDFGFYSTDDEDITDDDDITLKQQKLSATIPVNIAYSFQLSNGAQITPYTGFHLKANLLARCKEEYDGSYGGYYREDDEDWANLFDKKDVGKDGVWKRIQPGWQIGLGFSKGSFNMGVEYGIDFGELAKKQDSSNVLVSLGCNF